MGYPAVDTLNGYQAEAEKFAKYDRSCGIIYNGLKLASEAGEVAGRIGKALGHNNGNQDQGELALEMGDVLWHLTLLASEIGLRLSDIANMNLDKLAGRAERGTIAGNGDHR